MALNCLPITCPCGQHHDHSGIPEGLTHRPKALCPFQGDDNPVGPLGTCCSLYGQAAAATLESLGERHLSGLMHDHMTAERALDFAGYLRTAADQVRREQEAKRPDAAATPSAQAKEPAETSEKPTVLDLKLAVIHQAAAWYEKIGKLGFGVEAWH